MPHLRPQIRLRCADRLVRRPPLVHPPSLQLSEPLLAPLRHCPWSPDGPADGGLLAFRDHIHGAVTAAGWPARSALPSPPKHNALVYFIGKLSAGFGEPFSCKGEPARGSRREMPARGPEQPLRLQRLRAPCWGKKIEPRRRSAVRL